jgi:hypothetical protein
VPLYQVGLIPDNKLLDLLDMALAADTVNTVKGMRDLLESGVDALSLVAQLASLITNIIVGTFELSRDARKKGFFRRNLRKLHRIFTNSSILHVFEYMTLDSSYCNLHNLTFTCKRSVMTLDLQKYMCSQVLNKILAKEECRTTSDALKSLVATLINFDKVLNLNRWWFYFFNYSKEGRTATAASSTQGACRM